MYGDDRVTEDGSQHGGSPAPYEGLLLRIYLSETDRWERKALHRAIVDSARSFGIAGGAVVWGVEGFGRSRRVHTTRIERLSYDLPVVVMIADRADRIEELSAKLRPMVERKLVIWERLTIAPGPNWMEDSRW